MLFEKCMKTLYCDLDSNLLVIFKRQPCPQRGYGTGCETWRKRSLWTYRLLLESAAEKPRVLHKLAPVSKLARRQLITVLASWQPEMKPFCLGKGQFKESQRQNHLVDSIYNHPGIVLPVSCVVNVTQGGNNFTYHFSIFSCQKVFTIFHYFNW